VYAPSGCSVAMVERLVLVRKGFRFLCIAIIKRVIYTPTRVEYVVAPVKYVFHTLQYVIYPVR